VKVYLHTLLTSALDGGEWSASRRGRFTPRRRVPGSHWIGGWVGPSAGLDAVVKRKIPRPRRCMMRNFIIYTLLTYLLTSWCRTLFEKLIVIQLVKKYPAFFVETEGSLPCSQKPATGPYLDPAVSSSPHQSLSP
jgi:hypothetical protein